jgi:tetratricopeptide (TPR) repeat protein
MSETAASIGGGEAAFVASGGSGRYADDSSGCVHTTGVAHSGALPFGLRLANAAVAYATYLFKMVWSANLAVFYPHQGNSLSLWTATGAALLLAGISWAVWRGRGSGYLEVGWLWYLGTLVPVSGLIQAGGHSMADRHTYIPLIGVFIMLVWGTTQLARTLQLKKEWLIAASVCLVLTMAVLTRRQLDHWQDSATLFQHAVESTENNHLAHSNLGTALRRKGILDEAVNHLLQALEIQPDIPEAYNNLGIVLAQMGRTQEALEHFSRAKEVQPDYLAAYYNSGLLLEEQDRIEEAIQLFREILLLDPLHIEAQQRLVLLEQKMQSGSMAVRPAEQNNRTMDHKPIHRATQ